MYLPSNSQPLVSPIAVEIDECYRLWILDNGVQNISGIQVKTHPPVLQAIRLKSNSTVAKYYFEPSLRNSKSFFTTLEIDTGDTCQETWVYVADFNNAKLLVYDMQKNSSWLLSHHFFNPDPLSDVPLELIFNRRHKTASGIYGLASSGPYLNFHPFASKFEFRVDKKILKSHQPLLYGQVSIIGNRGSEAGIMRFDKTNFVDFYAGFRHIGCWANFENYTEIDIGLVEGFITDIQIVGPKLWILINSENKYTFETRIIEELIANTPCKRQLPHHRLLNKGYKKEHCEFLVYWILFFAMIIY